MFLDIKILTSLTIFLVASSALASPKHEVMLAKFVESNEITETDKQGSVRMIKTTAENCSRMLNGLVADIKSLAKFISKAEIDSSQWLQKKVLSFDSSDCKVREKRQDMFQIASNVIRESSRRVAILLPLSNFTASHSQSVKQGIMKGAGLSDAEFNKRFVFLDTHGNALGTDQAISKAYFIHNATVLVGGMSRIEADHISDWSRRLLMPSLITHFSEQVIEKNKRGFLVFPNLDNLFKGISETLKSQNLKKLAVLYPNNQDNMDLIQRFAVAMENGGIQITHKASYNSTDYQSMEAAAQRIFEIDAGVRRAEYNEIYRRLKRRARRANAIFNSRLVSLPPIINMDAVYIADNFRSVRYMAKIFEFLGVEKIRLFGNQQWRARSLIDPWDPFLDGAYFVDYVGSYTSLPGGLSVSSAGNFASPAQAQHIDYKLIGFLSGYAAKELVYSKSSSRSQMHLYLQQLNIDEPNFFGKRKVFLEGRATNWPYFKFMVGGRSLHLSH